jgi:circadian clock protein KaiC
MIRPLAKARSGVQGLDEVTAGGLPRGRATLVCGGPGCGKTLFGMEFLIRGAVEYGEPGVFMAFEETAEELAVNVASLGYDLARLEAEGAVSVDYVRVERSEIEETGEYDLEGLFVRLQYAIETVGAKRVVLDTIESLFSGLPNPAVLRAEIRRLFRWLKDRGMTVVVTGEKGEGLLTRQGLEEYVSDCVIFLDHRVEGHMSTRHLRVVKYRGSTHGTNAYPFLIDQRGISILPVTSLRLAHHASTERVSTGIARLDEMLGGKGYYKGSTVLVSGTAGTGKTTLAAALAASFGARGERCLYFASEESGEQLQRNMRSVGLDLAPHTEAGTLRVIASRPTVYGLEQHLVAVHRAVDDHAPSLVVLDPITNLTTVGTSEQVESTLIRLIDFLKGRGITTFFTSLTGGGDDLEQTGVGVSSLVDTWLLLSVVRSQGERNRTLTVIKSRGMAHSNQTSEYVLSERGLDLQDTYLGPHGVLTGSARLAQEAQDAAALAEHEAEVARREREHARRRRAVENQIGALREELDVEEAELQRFLEKERGHQEQRASERRAMASSRAAFESNGKDET